MHAASDPKPFRPILKVILAALTAALLLLWAWNMALPEVFGAPRIDYSNALGLVVLASIATIPFHSRLRHRNAPTDHGSGVLR